MLTGIDLSPSLVARIAAECPNVVGLKAEYPGLNPNEISRVCYVRFGRRQVRKTVKRVSPEEPIPLCFVRRFPPYHEFPER
jgi:hypothetical protein